MNRVRQTDRDTDRERQTDREKYKDGERVTERYPLELNYLNCIKTKQLNEEFAIK